MVNESVWFMSLCGTCVGVVHVCLRGTCVSTWYMCVTYATCQCGTCV